MDFEIVTAQDFLVAIKKVFPFKKEALAWFLNDGQGVFQSIVKSEGFKAAIEALKQVPQGNIAMVHHNEELGEYVRWLDNFSKNKFPSKHVRGTEGAPEELQLEEPEWQRLLRLDFIGTVHGTYGSRTVVGRYSNSSLIKALEAHLKGEELENHPQLEAPGWMKEWLKNEKN